MPVLLKYGTKKIYREEILELCEMREYYELSCNNCKYYKTDFCPKDESLGIVGGENAETEKVNTF